MPYIIQEIQRYKIVSIFLNQTVFSYGARYAQKLKFGTVGPLRYKESSYAWEKQTLMVDADL